MSKITIDQKILTIPCENILPGEYDSVFYLLEGTLKDIPTGVGLSAPQIGILKRAFIIRDGNKFIRYANPSIIKQDKSLYTEEMCLSIPGSVFSVQRFSSIFIRNAFRGKEEPTLLVDEMAVIFQHEYDHLDGITLLQSGTLIRNK